MRCYSRRLELYERYGPKSGFDRLSRRRGKESSGLIGRSGARGGSPRRYADGRRSPSVHRIRRQASKADDGSPFCRCLWRPAHPPGGPRRLVAWCGAAAALLANDSEAKARFSAFGRRLGVAFQIADDIRDITGLDRGKPQYADLQSRTPSLPILLAARRDQALSRRLKESWAFAAMTPARVSELGTALLCSGPIAGPLELLNAQIAGAVDALGAYASTQGGAELVGWAHRLESGIQGRSAA